MPYGVMKQRLDSSLEKRGPPACREHAFLQEKKLENPMTSVLIGERHRDTHGEETPVTTMAETRSGAATSQGPPRIAGNHQKLGKKQETELGASRTGTQT